ncbi:unnamed protein product [Rotaria magnacalcarata]|uniref:Dynactin subunit 1 n=6 Tax=Rotaria magnacalcarata TaxID=392030 RepID=A0A816CX70_9BILA|nr:unnamed protein product [Rotaria magnacalcarata]CAF1625808.1 unnamed protein product [Rotaria magnacalcarata]
MASATLFRLDQRVTIAGKGIGTIAFVGKTDFADGEWIGVILDEPKGKNNGTVPKKDGTTVRYFTCNDNHGLYVRPAQIESVINDLQTELVRSTSNHSIKSQASSTGSIPPPSNLAVPRTSTLPAKPSGLRAPVSNAVPKRPVDGDIDETGLNRTAQSSSDIPAAVAVEKISPPKEEVKSTATPSSQAQSITSMPPPAAIPPIDSNHAVKKSIGSTLESSDSQQTIASLKNKIIDQEEQIQTLIKKRRDDLEKIKEFERTKLQLDQLQTYKREAQDRIKELNEKLQQQEHALKDTRDRFAAYRDEMTDTEVRIESLALDLEMAEEKLETITSENATLQEKFEEAQLELDIIKGEIQLNGSNQVANDIQQKVDDERTIKMEQALIKLRDLSLTKQAENETLKKQCEALEHKVKILSKENENAKAEITAMQATIADLTEQVDTCLGAQQMVEILTNKNLSLEDQVRELQENVDNLESLCEMDKEMEENAKEVERDLRETIDLLQNQLREKDRQIEQLQYTIGDHERTILKFRETVKNMQFQNDQCKKQIEKYEEQLKLAGSVQSSEFKAKIVETKSYGEIIENEIKKLDVQNLTKHVNLLTLFLPEQFLKRGADQDCILALLLVHRLISKCDLLTIEVQKRFPRVDQISFDDVVNTHRAEEWSFACKLSQSLSIFQLILQKFVKAMGVCNPDTLRHVASTYHDLLSHEKSLDLLLDLLQKDQLHDSLSLNTLDKTISFYEHIYKSYLSQEKFSMSTYLRDLTRVVLSSSDSLQADIQRIQVLQKSGNDQSPFALLTKRLIESNEQMRAQVSKINRLVPQEDDKNRSLVLDSNSISSIESSIRNLDRLTKTFHEICSGLTTQILLLSDANDRVSTQDIENIAYQACDKIYKKEDSGPYESLRDSMHETVSTLSNISDSLETGSFDSTVPPEQNAKQSIYVIAEQFKTSINEADLIRSKLELKEEEILEIKKMLKLKHDELSELNIRLSLNEKKIDTLQKELEEKDNKHKQTLEEIKVDGQKKIKQCEEAMAVLQNDNEQLEHEKSALKERLKQLTKNKLVDDLMQKKIGGTLKPTGSLNSSSDGIVSPQCQLPSPSVGDGNLMSTASEQEISALRNTVRHLKEEIWHLKMSRSSVELTKLEQPASATNINEIADIYKTSTLLLNDLFSSIASYKITGENVAAKHEIIRSKMKLVDQTANNLNTRLYQCQSNITPGSMIETKMKTFSNPDFSKSLTADRLLAAEIQLPGGGGGGELNITQEQYRTIMRQAIGCV